MTSNKVWFITGAGRGMGVAFAKAALAAGHSVMATGRNIETVRKAVGAHDEQIVVLADRLADRLDVAASRYHRVPRAEGGLGELHTHAASGTGDEPHLVAGHVRRSPV